MSIMTLSVIFAIMIGIGVVGRSVCDSINYAKHGHDIPDGLSNAAEIINKFFKGGK